MKAIIRSSMIWWGLLLPLQLLAHGVTTEQIKQITELIQREPLNANLYLRRGELYRISGNAKAALEDYEQVQKLAPTMIEVDVLRARLSFDAKTPEMTQFVLDRFLKQHPTHTEALLLRAKANAVLGEKNAAIQDYSQALALLAHPKPDFYLARAELQLAVHHPEAALQGLEQGMAKLGALIVLQLMALDIEVNLKRWNAALTRLDLLTEQAPRKESWLIRRGEILWQAGRKVEAHQSINAGLEAISALPAYLQRTTAITELTTKAKHLLGNSSR